MLKLSFNHSCAQARNNNKMSFGANGKLISRVVADAAVNATANNARKNMQESAERLLAARKNLATAQNEMTLSGAFYRRLDIADKYLSEKNIGKQAYYKAAYDRAYAKDNLARQNTRGGYIWWNESYISSKELEQSKVNVRETVATVRKDAKGLKGILFWLTGKGNTPEKQYNWTTARLHSAKDKFAADRQNLKAAKAEYKQAKADFVAAEQKYQTAQRDVDKLAN